MLLPMHRKSNTDRLEAIRPIPYTDSEDPMRIKVLRDMVDP
jgi:hypothetical protein